MALPPELRLEIYRHIFTPSQIRRCEFLVDPLCAGENCFSYKRASSPPGYPGPHRSLQENTGPITCFPVETDILRVSKQTHREALPIMWQSVEFAMIMQNFKIFRKSAPEFVKRSFKFEDEDIALNVKRMVLAIPFRCPTLRVVPEDPYPQILAQLELYCELIKERRPRLRELRVYLDRWSIIPPRERYFREVVEALEVVVKRLDGIVLHIDIHTCRLNGRDSDRLLQQDVVKSLRERVKQMEKDISIESWVRSMPVTESACTYVSGSKQRLLRLKR